MPHPAFTTILILTKFPSGGPTLTSKSSCHYGLALMFRLVDGCHDCGVGGRGEGKGRSARPGLGFRAKE